MFNILIITLLLSTIYNYFFQKKTCITLNCGIFAWTGISTDNFSPLLFNVLGIYNDNRGGDSCGVYFNRNSIRGIGTTAKYESLVKSQKLHTTIQLGKYPIAIGHCRKASVGTVNEANIQPISLRSKKNNRLVFVQAHNGTISNQSELADKYGIVIEKNESDSIVLAKLIERVGFKVLEEYEGSAALVMHFTKEPNVLYAFRGQSKSYAVLTEERPLHYINIEGSGTYISSEAAPLEFISNGKTAISFKPNIVYKLAGDKVEEFQKINRNDVVSKKYTYQGYNWETNSYYNNFPAVNIVKTGVQRNICCSEFDTLTNSYGTSFKIYYYKGFYMNGKEYAHGKFLVNPWGYIRHETETMTDIYTLYFFYGILLTNKEAFDELMAAAAKHNIDNAVELYQQPAFNMMDKLITNNSVHPFTRLATNPSIGYMAPSIHFHNNDKSTIPSTFFSGNFTPLFSNCDLFFSNGDFNGYKKTGAILSLSTFLTDNPELENTFFFGLSDVEYDKKNNLSILSCDDCISQNGYPDHTDCATCDKSFKFEVSRSHTCLNCGDESCAYFKKYGIDDDGVECSSWIPETTADNKKTMLCHIIADGITPVIDNISDLINDIEITGFKDVVQNEYDVIIDVNNKLKEIVK